MYSDVVATSVSHLRVVFVEKNETDWILPLPTSGTVREHVYPGPATRVERKEAVQGCLFKRVPDLNAFLRANEKVDALGSDSILSALQKIDRFSERRKNSPLLPTAKRRIWNQFIIEWIERALISIFRWQWCE